jgi:hypothetical protein
VVGIKIRFGWRSQECKGVIGITILQVTNKLVNTIGRPVLAGVRFLPPSAKDAKDDNKSKKVKIFFIQFKIYWGNIMGKFLK